MKDEKMASGGTGAAVRDRSGLALALMVASPFLVFMGALLVAVPGAFAVLLSLSAASLLAGTVMLRRSGTRWRVVVPVGIVLALPTLFMLAVAFGGTGDSSASVEETRSGMVADADVESATGVPSRALSGLDPRLEYRGTWAYGTPGDATTLYAVLYRDRASGVLYVVDLYVVEDGDQGPAIRSLQRDLDRLRAGISAGALLKKAAEVTAGGKNAVSGVSGDGKSFTLRPADELVLADQDAKYTLDGGTWEVTGP